jgi:hypothetical protein
MAHKTTAQKRRAAREAKKVAEFRALNFHIIGSCHRNMGKDLVIDKEWDTPDGFRVRQVAVKPSLSEPGYFIGVVKVLAFADKVAQ